MTRLPYTTRRSTTPSVERVGQPCRNPPCACLCPATRRCSLRRLSRDDMGGRNDVCTEPMPSLLLVGDIGNLAQNKDILMSGF